MVICKTFCFLSRFDKLRYKKTNAEYDFSYKTKYEFKETVSRGSEVVFERKGIEYGIFRHDDKRFWFGRQDNSISGVYTLDELMNAEIEGKKLIDICTKITVIERTF